MTAPTAIGRAIGILLAVLFAPALAGVLTRCGRGSVGCPLWGRP